MTVCGFSRCEPGWLDRAVAEFGQHGFCLIEDVLTKDFLGRTADGLYRVREQIYSDVGQDRLTGAGEIGVLRLMQRYDPHFIAFLEIPEVLQLIDATLSDTAVQHTQNGFIMPPWEDQLGPEVFQTRFHRDFPRYLNGHLMSINLYFPISDFSAHSGATMVVPGSHQSPTRPDDDEIAATAISVECPAGAMLAFDSTLWHAAGTNRSSENRLSVNHQFTRSYLKQQLDYPRALGWDTCDRFPPRTQQLPGYFTRVPPSLDEYYQPSERRLYRAGQG